MIIILILLLSYFSGTVTSFSSHTQSDPVLKYDELLKKYVSESGRVNYAGLKSEVEALDHYLDHIKENKVTSSDSREERLVYWINSYNAFTLKLIVNNYPVKSIKDIYGGNPWDKKWIEIGGTSYSLNQIENEIIRPTFKEPRIHFAVNCAAVSCPPLLNRIWKANTLEQDLEKQTKEFITNKRFNKFDSKEVQVSQIFQWYKTDFGQLDKFLSKYIDKNLDNTTITFVEYDWSLNE